MLEPDNRAINQWGKSDKTYRNYEVYLKKNKFHLTFIDLLYVSNFKGGNATINEFENDVNNKLNDYSKRLNEIDIEFRGKELKNLTEIELKILIVKVQDIFDLVKKSETKIDGFSYSYLSTLLHFYFPDLLPILDRRVLINSKIVEYDNYIQVDKYGQIIKIEDYYEKLIRFMRNELKNSNSKLRELDRKLFIGKIPKRKN